jgi:hypothetical protein
VRVLITELVNSQSTSTKATDAYLIGSTTSVFAISALQLRLLPILVTIGLGLLVVLPSGYVFVLITEHMPMQSRMATPWLAMLANRAVMLVIALAELRHGMIEKPLKAFRISLGNRRVYTTFCK